MNAPLSRYAHPLLTKHAASSIVNVGSVSGETHVRSGAPYGSTDLHGHIWVADFIFTTCPDICPALTAQMRRLDEL